MNKNNFDFIEIGTSDFESELLSEEYKNGISIEPLKFYLDNLPNKEGFIKINCGISDVESTTQIFYIDPENIKKYNLPDFLKGCNSINSCHPEILSNLRERQLSDDLISSQTINLKSLKTIYEEYNIGKVKYLKIDTEGHDCIILLGCLSFLSEMQKEDRPQRIRFESNHLTNRDLLNKVLENYATLGYRTVSYNGADAVMEIF